MKIIQWVQLDEYKVSKNAFLFELSEIERSKEYSVAFSSQSDEIFNKLHHFILLYTITNKP